MEGTKVVLDFMHNAEQKNIAKENISDIEMLMWTIKRALHEKQSMQAPNESHQRKDK